MQHQLNTAKPVIIRCIKSIVFDKIFVSNLLRNKNHMFCINIGSTASTTLFTGSSETTTAFTGSTESTTAFTGSSESTTALTGDVYEIICSN